MDRWAWEQLRQWPEVPRTLPVGALFCVIHGPTRGRRWAAASACAQLLGAATRAGIRRRFAPHQLRHAHAVEMAHEGVPLVVIQRQLGHANLGITSIYLQGIDNAEIIETVHTWPAPVIPAAAGLRAPSIRRCNCSPGGRSTWHRCSLPERPIGEPFRSPAASNVCRAKRARECWAVAVSTAPDIGCSRSSRSA